MKYLLDTCVISELIKPTPNASVVDFRNRKRGGLHLHHAFREFRQAQHGNDRARVAAGRKILKHHLEWYSFRKTPKWYLRDWSGIADEGRRAETFVACHLLKAVEGWSDLGFGEFELFYVRDKKKREVDFLMTRDKKPWFVAEVKKSDENLSPSLSLFQKQTGAAHAFQIVAERPYEERDCFDSHIPMIVSARTFLSQLL